MRQKTAVPIVLIWVIYLGAGAEAFFYLLISLQSNAIRDTSLSNLTAVSPETRSSLIKFDRIEIAIELIK